MNPADLQKFNQAIQLAQAGQSAAAYPTLYQLYATYPQDSNLLLWLTFSAPSLAQSRVYLQQLATLDPANPALVSARDWLATQEAKQSPVLSTPVAAQSYASAATGPLVSEPAPKPSPAVATSPEPADLRAQLGSTPDKPSKERSKPRKAKPANPLDDSRSQLYWAVGITSLILLVIAVWLILFANRSDSPPPDSSLVVGGLGTGASATTYGTPIAGDTDRVAAQGVPVYSSAGRVNLDNADRQKVSQSFLTTLRASLPAGATPGNLATEVYALRLPSAGEAFKFYDTNLKNQGWSSSVSIEPGSQVYTKNGKLLGLFSRPANGLGLDSRKYGLPAGGSLLVILVQDYK